MAKFRYLGSEIRAVSMLPAGVLRKLDPDELFDVPDAVADSYECQPGLYRREDEPRAPRPPKAKASPEAPEAPARGDDNDKGGE